MLLSFSALVLLIGLQNGHACSVGFPLTWCNSDKEGRLNETQSRVYNVLVNFAVVSK